jgi:hypothetical protein
MILLIAKQNTKLNSYLLKIVKMEDKVCLEKVTQNNNHVCHPMHYCTSLKLGRITA